MKKDNYDLVILTNCPSFYKVNMYNEINTKVRLFVIFLGFSDDVIINSDFDEKCKFDYNIINRLKLSERNILSTFFKIKKQLNNISYKKIIYGGYIYPEFIALSYIIPKIKNVLETESASETVIKGWRFWLKKNLLKRYTVAIASGKIHAKMLRIMKFDGPIEISKGVGIMEKPNKLAYKRNEELTNNPLKFLYVGRLIELKNVEFIINEFNDNGLPLTIIGDGVIANKLKSIAKQNITFLGFQDNKTLGEFYTKHDVFILPSLQEAWGLVVEEALYWGCVLLLSERVGSSTELLIEPKTGATFNPVSDKSFNYAINDVIQNFAKYKKNVEDFDINAKDIIQIKAYIDLLKY